MLFKTTKSTEQEAEEENLPPLLKIQLQNKLAIGTKQSVLENLLPSIEPNTAIHMPSYANWSFHHLIQYLLQLTGPSKLYLTSWTIAEQPVKDIVRLMDNHTITELHCLLDSRIKINCPNAYQIAQHRIANLKLCHIHAKLAVIINDNFHVVVNSSANLSRNSTIETYVITESIDVANFHKEWILGKIEEANPFEE